MGKFIDLVGRKFDRLLVKSLSENRLHNRISFLCVCDCGKEKIVTSKHLLNGLVTSCGCKKVQRLTKHGYYNHPLYNAWRHMKARCYNPRHPCYKDYGGRGIIICKEWQDRRTFIEWGLENGWLKGLQIDRIDNDEGYNPKNCRFVDARTNTSNTRKQKLRDLPVGVYKQSNKFRVRVRVGNKNIQVRMFDKVEDAEQAHKEFIKNIGNYK